MSDEQAPPGRYMDALMGAGGKRERLQAAHTGMTPPAKAASPNHLGGSEEEANIESEAGVDGRPPNGQWTTRSLPSGVRAKKMRSFSRRLSRAASAK